MRPHSDQGGAGGGRSGGAIPSGKGAKGPTGGGPSPIRVPIDDQDRLPTLENESEDATGRGKAEVRHDALEGEGGMEPPGWTEQ